MFVRDLDPFAWVFAAILETIFALVINMVAYRQLRKLKLTDITK